MTIVLLGCVIGCFLAWLIEKKIWNNGICRKNGLPWIYFDTDSQGGRGYRSSDFTCWISWPGVDKEKP